MAKYSKKRARELKHDVFRDTTMNAFDRLGDRMEGQGRTIIYAISAVVALAILAGALQISSRSFAERRPCFIGAPVAPPRIRSG